MVGLLSSALTIAGSAGAGGFKAAENISSDKIKNAAMKIRDENKARLNDMYAEKAANRQHGLRIKEIEKTGEINADQSAAEFERDKEQREIERKAAMETDELIYQRRKNESDAEYKRRTELEDKKFSQRLTESLANAKQVVEIKDSAKTEIMKNFEFYKKELGEETAKGLLNPSKDTALDKSKAFNKAYADNLKVIAGDMPATPEHRKTALAVTKDMFTGFGIDVRNIDNTGGQPGGDTRLNQLLNNVNAMGEKDSAEQPKDASPQNSNQEMSPVPEEDRMPGQESPKVQQGILAGNEGTEPEQIGRTEDGLIIGYDPGTQKFVVKNSESEEWRNPNESEQADVNKFARSKSGVPGVEAATDFVRRARNITKKNVDKIGSVARFLGSGR